jgi:hypothetical protein
VLDRVLSSRSLETLLNTKIGDSTDSFFRYITLKKWQKKFSGLDKKDFKIAMKSTKNVSKHHPQNFQRKVIDRLNDDYNKLNLKYNLETVN